MPDVNAAAAGPALSPHVQDTLQRLDDTELLAMVRADGQARHDAFATLFRRYSYPALRLARHLGQREEADDVVDEAFAQILQQLLSGRGPEQSFRAYLFTTVRHESSRRGRARLRVVPTDDDTQIDTAVPFGGGGLDAFERSAIRAAYASLPDRWRTALWHLDVEGHRPHELSDLLEISPNGVSALVYRARAGLREAYLRQHLSTDEPAREVCRRIRPLLSSVVRRSATMRQQEAVHTHLAECRECMAAHLDLEDVNRSVSG